MREAIGGSFILRVVMVLIVIYIIFLALGINYTLSFRLKNGIIQLLEEYEGAENSFEKIKSYVESNKYYQGKITDVELNNCSYNKNTVCIQEVSIDNGKTNNVYYKVTIYLSIDVPILGNLLMLPISGESSSIEKYTGTTIIAACIENSTKSYSFSNSISYTCGDATESDGTLTYKKCTSGKWGYTSQTVKSNTPTKESDGNYHYTWNFTLPDGSAHTETATVAYQKCATECNPGEWEVTNKTSSGYTCGEFANSYSGTVAYKLCNSEGKWETKSSTATVTKNSTGTNGFTWNFKLDSSRSASEGGTIDKVECKNVKVSLSTYLIDVYNKLWRAEGIVTFNNTDFIYDSSNSNYNYYKYYALNSTLGNLPTISTNKKLIIELRGYGSMYLEATFYGWKTGGSIVNSSTKLTKDNYNLYPDIRIHYYWVYNKFR